MLDAIACNAFNRAEDAAEPSPGWPELGERSARVALNTGLAERVGPPPIEPRQPRTEKLPRQRAPVITDPVLAAALRSIRNKARLPSAAELALETGMPEREAREQLDLLLHLVMRRDPDVVRALKSARYRG